MVALLIALLLTLALVAALRPAHRRSWRPGFDSRVDRDRARLREELDLLQGFEPPMPSEPTVAAPVCQDDERPEAA